MTLAPGQIIDGKYRILRCLGQGGMGAVFLGKNTRIGRQVAIKVLHASLAGQGPQVERFELEAQLAARVVSDHIVDIFDMGDLPGGHIYMVMEFLDGESLGAKLMSQGCLAAEYLSAVALQALEGLAEAHAVRVIHRDLKPDNVFLVPRGKYELVKLLDFGISKVAGDPHPRGGANLTMSGMLVGTPAYMSPEQARGQPIDHRTDLYALGVVLYECLTGRTPFSGQNVQELLFRVALGKPPPLELALPDLDRDFAAVVRKAMSHAPEQRYQSAFEFRSALAAWREARGLDPDGMALSLGQAPRGLRPFPISTPSARRLNTPASWVAPTLPPPPVASDATPTLPAMIAPVVPPDRLRLFAAAVALLLAGVGGLALGRSSWGMAAPVARSAATLLPAGTTATNSAPSARDGAPGPARAAPRERGCAPP